MAAVFLLLAPAFGQAILEQTTFEVVHDFGSSPGDGAQPVALLQATDGLLYGTTRSGGPGAAGTIFKIDRDGVLATIHAFRRDDGREPNVFIESSDGSFYGLTAYGGARDQGTFFRFDREGVLTTMHSFDYSTAGWPYLLIESSQGSFYGAAADGCETAWIFKLDRGGAVTVLQTLGFVVPQRLVESRDGAFYGSLMPVTLRGEEDSVFRLDRDGTFTTFYSFGAPVRPFALIESSDGRFYGTTMGDGANESGAVFRLERDGAYGGLHSFGGGHTGWDPRNLIESGRERGIFYGTTYGGGAHDGGTIFRLDRDATFSTLHDFGEGDGTGPRALIESRDGSLYGTTDAGGGSGGGVVFRLVPANPAVSSASSFRRGDANDDRTVDISDAVSILNWLFVGGETPGCIAAANTNGDEAVDIADPAYLLRFAFLGGPSPVAPFPGCGAGELPADESLGCADLPTGCR